MRAFQSSLFIPMDPLFTEIARLDDLEPHSGAMNMAIDELLLRSSREAVLRIYRWDTETASFGYTMKFTDVRSDFPDIPLVRRWTGGGIVEHGTDLTFSLIVPRTVPFADLRPVESYRKIHEAVLAAFRDLIPKAGFAAPREIADGPACFDSPRQHDLMLGERKFCGGAQRRTREGILHQGSIQGLSLPDDAAQRLADALAAKVAPCMPDTSLSEEARSLAEAKYASRAWNELR